MKNENGQFLLGQVPFVQFLRCEGNWTGAWVLNPMSGTSLHARFHAGAGWAGENFNALPFDRSFFTGSANGIRGWPARQLGPGHTGYDIDALNVVKGLGDLLGEVSLEVRKQSTNMIEWAWFVDVGNVWLMKQPLLEDALSDTRLEWSSLGFSSGIGIRLDFDFFLFSNTSPSSVVGVSTCSELELLGAALEIAEGRRLRGAQVAEGGARDCCWGRVAGAALEIAECLRHAS